MVVLLGASASVSAYSGGDGSAENPYRIATPNDMNEIGTNPDDWDAHFVMVNDVNLADYTGTEFNIIGYWKDWDDPENEPFTGVFDGNGHTISNFTYTTDADGIGLFAHIDDVNSEIKDLTLIDPNVDAGTGENVGCLVGLFGDGMIFCCGVAGGSVTGDDNIGGLVGGNKGCTISNCYSTSSVTGEGDTGGLVGYNKNTISNCYSTGPVVGVNATGGLVGKNWYGTLINCYAAGSVTGVNQTGGLVGYTLYSPYIHSFWDRQTSNQSNGIGAKGGGGRWITVTGKTTTEMKMESTFFVWACEGVWTIDDGNDYPRLSWENRPGDLITKPAYAEGSGTQANPYLIATAEQLNTIGMFWCDWDKHFKLVNNINLAEYTGTQFNIIGRYVSGNHPANVAFTGVFDGNGHSISNFTYGSVWTDYVGLFGYIDAAEAEIKHLTLINAHIDAGGEGSTVGAVVGCLTNGTVTGCCIEGGTVSGRAGIGGLVGRNPNGTISNCHATASVLGTLQNHGGLVGYNGGTISNCYATTPVLGVGWYTGGLVGGNGGTISNCYATGIVDGYDGTGGLVGRNTGTISHCHATGNVSGDDDSTGGLSGVNCPSGTISGCYATGDVECNRLTGGLVGNNGGSIIACYSTGNVEGDDSIGGLIGDNHEGSITDSYATGSVTGFSGTGGLVGFNGWYGTISRCYAAGSVMGYHHDTGGLVGYNLEGTVSKCYATGSVSGALSVGGLVGGNVAGEAGGTISDSYATGEVLGGDTAGGLIGGNHEGSITDCYATGSVIAGGGEIPPEHVGGLVGYDDVGSYTSCFWNCNVNPDVNGIGNATDPNVIGESTANMQTESTFTGWDFVNTWDICDGTNYPKLTWQIPVPGDFVCPDGVDMRDFAVLAAQWRLEKLSADVAPDGGDGIVNFLDWAVFADGWQSTTDIYDLAVFVDQWLSSYCADIAPDGGDGVVNMRDLRILAENWLEGIQ